MPDSNSIASLYPQPPAAAPAALNPLQIVDLATRATQLQGLQRGQAAQQAIGGAYQTALQPDGSVDMGGLSTALKSDPAATYGLPEAASNMLNQQNAQLLLDSKRNQFVVDGVGALANDPSLSQDSVRDFGVKLARNLKIPGAFINNWLDDLPDGKAALRNKLIQFRNVAIGSGASNTPTSAVTPSGAQGTVPRDVYNYQTAGGGVMPTELPPGEAALLGSPSERAAALQATASSSPQYHADLENLRQDSAVMGNLGGPIQDVEKKLNQLSTRIAGFGITMTPDQLRASESFDKIANSIALNQGKMMGGTDATRTMSVGATPSSGMSRYGRDGVIDMLHGNQDAIDAARDSWLGARSNGAPASSFDLFMNRLGKSMDPRVFQFNRLSRDNQQKFLNQMPPQDVPGFEQKYQAAVQRGWVPPLKAANGQ
jgi:hypothetical protein